MLEQLDAIADTTGIKRARLIDVALGQFVESFRNKSVVRNCSVCGRIYRTDMLDDKRLCDKCAK
jgi:hypothetical protein